MTKAVPVGLVVLMVCSVFAPTVAATDTTQGDSIQDRASVEAPTEQASTQPTADQQSPAAASLQEVDEVPYDDLSDQLEALASVDPESDVSVNESLNESQQDAAREGARDGAQLAQQQGVDITQAQINATVNSSLRAAAQFQNVSAEQIQAATTGAAHGALVQSQQVNVTQVQAGVYASATGALSQSTNVTQAQAAAYGAAHGSVAQYQRANVTQIQFAAVGAAAGAAHANSPTAEESESATQTQQVNVTQVQEAAQGAAYGALEQRQQVNVTQRQAAAFGAAGGAVESKSGANPKKVQESAMGAAQGTLVQVQQVTITQIQAAARGACKGALAQSQNVTVTQIQQSSMGAAEGALSQSQGATVVQIQAAALGAARGTITQVQSVTVVQVQQAAFGAAAGAVGSAVQHQVTNVRQIQAAATGAASGTVIQIQQINIVQIQVIAQSAASGAISQSQGASVTQIQSAARGASEGSLALTQRQTVSIEQIQTSTRRAAADTVQVAVEIDVTQEVTIYNYAKGTAENPEADEADGEDGDADEQDRLRSLFASVDDETVFLANPNDVAVTVTVTNETGGLQTVTLAAGESTSLELDPGTYTLTAETDDGRDVELAGRADLTVTVGDQLQPLTATVDNQTLTVDNPNDQRVVVTATADDGEQVTFEVPRDWTVAQRLDAGTYTLTAETTDGQSVQVNDESATEVTIEAVGAEPEEPDPIDLTVNVDGQNLTLENPGNATATVTVTGDDGDEQPVEVAANATETVTLDPGTYTLTGESDDRDVVFEGQSTYEFTISEVAPIDLDVTVEEGNVTITNPSETAVTVTASGDAIGNRTIELAAGETVTEQFEPGDYTLTADSDERQVLVDGESTYEFTVAAPDEPAPIDLDVTVDGQNVSITNPNETAVTVTAAAEGVENRTLEIAADETVTEAFEPGTYTLTGESEERDVLVEGESAYELTIDESEPIDLNVTIDGQTVSIANPSDSSVTVTASAEGVDNRTIEVAANETATEQFDPGNYTLTAESADREVLVEGESAYEVTVAGPDEAAPIDLDVTVDGQNVTITNPNETAVTVTASAEGVENRTIAVGADETVTEQFDSGTYTLTGESEERDVLVEGESAHEVTIAGAEPEAIDLGVSVTAQNVTVQNPSDTVATVIATAEGAENRTLEIPANETVSDQFEPGTYTLTAESPERDVLLNGAPNLTITVEESGPDLTIDACRNVTQPGEYELTADLQATGERSCLQVQSADVTIDGNGYAIAGDGPVADAELDEGTANAGILVYNETADQDESPLDNVTVRNVEATGWNAGIQSDLDALGAVSDVTIADSEFRDNENGVSLMGQNATLLNVTVADNEDGLSGDEAGPVTVENATIEANDRGVNATEETNITLDRSTVQNNAEDGVVTSLGGVATVVNSTVSGNDGAGVESETSGAISLSNTTVSNNGDAGVQVDGELGADLENVTVVDNGAEGLLLNESATLDNVTVTDNVGLALNATEGSATATALHLGDSLNTTFTDESVALDDVEQASLPGLPEDATALGPGLNASSLDGDVQVRFEVDATETDETETTDGTATDQTDEGVQLWRYDGTEWTTAVNETESVDGVVTETISDDGIYALVSVPAEGDLAVNATVGDRVVWAENPTDEPLTVTVANESGTVQTLTLDADANESITGLDPGAYTLTAATDADESVPVNGETEWSFELPPDLDSLALTVEDNVTATNPNDESVELTVANESGVVTTLAIPADSAAQIDGTDLETGTYTASAQTLDDRSVPVDGQWNLTFAFERPEAPADTTTAAPTETETATATATETAIGPETETATATDTVETETATASPTETSTAAPTETTETSTATVTAEPTPLPTETDTATPTATATGAETDTTTDTAPEAQTSTDTAAELADARATLDTAVSQLGNLFANLG